MGLKGSVNSRSEFDEVFDVLADVESQGEEHEWHEERENGEKEVRHLFVLNKSVEIIELIFVVPLRHFIFNNQIKTRQRCHKQHTIDNLTTRGNQR